MGRIAAFVLLLAGAPAMAQQGGFVSPLDGQPGVPNPGAIVPDAIPPAAPLRLIAAEHTVLRVLDKVSGVATEVELARGDVQAAGELDVRVGECRYPEDDPSGEAYAWVDIRDRKADRELFQGWMVASSPALNALDHPRYDVWVIRCATS